jgi:hypothetical protein
MSDLLEIISQQLALLDRYVKVYPIPPPDQPPTPLLPSASVPWCDDDLERTVIRQACMSLMASVDQIAARQEEVATLIAANAAELGVLCQYLGRIVQALGPIDSTPNPFDGMTGDFGR